MTWELALDILLDALKDSALIFAFVLLVHVLLSFIDLKLANFLVKRRKTAPIFGSLFGLIPQCGTSVLGADLYIKKYITLGTLTAIFLSCSDEAFITLLTGWNERTIYILPLIGLKFAIGVLVGIIIDLIDKRELKEVEKPLEHTEECSHIHHHDEHDEHVESNLHKHLIHPLLHSLEIFAYVLIINLALGFIIGFVGEENFANFIQTNKYLAPLFSSIIGLIPNCASSLLLSELFINGSLSFGALLGGLLVNSGLGLAILLKSKEKRKDVLLIVGITFTISVLTGYITCLVSGF